MVNGALVLLKKKKKISDDHFCSEIHVIDNVSNQWHKANRNENYGHILLTVQYKE